MSKGLAFFLNPRPLFCEGVNMGSRENERKRANKVSVIILVFFLLLCLTVALGYLGFNWYSGYKAEKTYGELRDSAQKETVSELAENPIDFASLKSRNDDIYAWIKIPNTNIDYPVVQSKIDDNYYLNRSIEKTYLFAGMIFSQSCNSLDFYDSVTVLYGHNMNNGSMFAELHKFQDEDFFNNNDTFYVYTVNHILTYRVVSAFKYDNRHIMNSFDFDDVNQLEEFQNTVLQPQSLLKNVRDDIKLDKNSKVIVLSTCIGDKRARYLVCGVLTEDEKTK